MVWTRPYHVKHCIKVIPCSLYPRNDTLSSGQYSSMYSTSRKITSNGCFIWPHFVTSTVEKMQETVEQRLIFPWRDLERTRTDRRNVTSGRLHNKGKEGRCHTFPRFLSLRIPFSWAREPGELQGRPEGAVLKVFKRNRRKSGRKVTVRMRQSFLQHDMSPQKTERQIIKRNWFFSSLRSTVLNGALSNRKPSRLFRPEMKN